MDILVAIGPGVLASLVAAWIYGFVSHMPAYRGLKYRKLTGHKFHYYWYDSKTLRGAKDGELRHAIVEIYRNWLGLIRMRQTEVSRDDDPDVCYNYKGSVLVTGNQVHFRKYGSNHLDIGYTVFDRPLNALSDIFYGITLVTSSDRRGRLIAMQCLLSAKKMAERDAHAALHRKAYVTPPAGI